MSIKARLAVGLLTLSVAGVAGLKMQEGRPSRVYLDPVGIPTACYGHTGKDVTKADVGKRVSDDVCDAMLGHDTGAAERAVKRLVKVPVTQEQFDALVDFTFNVGEANFASSTLLKQVNLGNCPAATQQFGRWVFAKGEKLPGLVNRRNMEAAWWSSGC